MGKDATGHTRGAGVYSRSYPKLVKPPLNPRTARDIYGAVEDIGERTSGFAANVSRKQAREEDGE